MAMGGISIWHVFLIVVLPLIHVIRSRRSQGGAKIGWSLAVIFFPLLGYIIYLIVTQPAKNAQQSS